MGGADLRSCSFVQTPTMSTLTFPPGQQIPQPHFQALQDSLRGSVYFAGDQTCVALLKALFFGIDNSDQFLFRRFADHSKIFNGAIRTKAVAVAMPEDASDVSKWVESLHRGYLGPLLTGRR